MSESKAWKLNRVGLLQAEIDAGEFTFELRHTGKKTTYTEGDFLAYGRLATAAPDLLEALKAVVRVADRKTVEFDMARAAIAKAEG